jgi:hypothetical protein
VAKDRAAPFSRKHRRYWIPVTGGMLLIGVINVAIGFCTYREPSGPPERIVPDLTRHDAAGAIGRGEIPTAVMRAFNARYPRTLPAGARRDGTTYTVLLPPGAPHTSATFAADGTLVSEQ